MRIALVFLSSLMLVSCSSEQSGIIPNQWNVVNYWAIWCKPCREEIPELNQLNQVDNVVVLGVNFDRKVGEALVSDAAELGIEFTIIDDPAPHLDITRPSVLPTTLILSPDGDLVATLVGPQTAESIPCDLRQRDLRRQAGDVAAADNPESQRVSQSRKKPGSESTATRSVLLLNRKPPGMIATGLFPAMPQTTELGPFAELE